MEKRGQVLGGKQGVGGDGALRDGREFTILAKDFASVQQSVPLTVAYGTPYPIAGFQITPIFQFDNEPITTKAGK